MSGNAPTNQRTLVLAAARQKIARRAGLLPRLAEVDERIIAGAIATFGDVNSAAEWLATPAYGLGGNVPVDHCATSQGTEQVQILPTRIDYGIP